MRTFYLVELGQVSAVDGLVPEHPVDAEVLGRPEALLRQPVHRFLVKGLGFGFRV